MSVYSNKFKSITSKKGPAHGPEGQHDRSGTPEHKLAALGEEARSTPPPKDIFGNKSQETGRILDLDLADSNLVGVTKSGGPIPRGVVCRETGSVNLGTPPGTGGDGGSRTTTNAITSTPPAWSGNEPDCPITSQESIDNFASPNRPKTSTPKKSKPVRQAPQSNTTTTRNPVIGKFGGSDTTLYVRD